MSIEPRTCEAVIDVEAIRRNARVLMDLQHGRDTVADLRADGYGHGAVPSALAALDGGARVLGVSSVADARTLREAGINARILVSRAPHRGQAADIRELDLMVRTAPSAPEGMAETGALLYGLGAQSASCGFVPAMRVTASVIGTKTIERGEGVSYGYTFRAAKRTNIAMLGIGYADGLDRRAGNIASVRLADIMRRIIGRVAMNAAMLELGTGTATLGDEAVIFGALTEPLANHWASALGIPDVEAAVVFGRHLPRRYR